MDEDAIETAKRRAGERAAETVEDGRVVGLGTGSTAAHAIRTLGDRVDSGLSIRGIPTSFQSRRLAIEAGIDLVEPDEVDGIDVAIDGTDQVADGDLLKGGGAAHAREKVIDAAADRLLIVADPRKLVEVLDDPVPVAVLPVARRPVKRAIEREDGDPRLRAADRKDGPVVTDDRALVLDCDLGRIERPATTARWLSELPGVVEHGLFVGMADRVFVGGADGVSVREFQSQ